MKNAKAKFATLSQALRDEPSEIQEEVSKPEPVKTSVKTPSQKAVKTSSQLAPNSRMHVAKPVPQASSAEPAARAEENDGEPRRQMTVKLPLSLYAKLSEEKSRRVVANNKSWSIQDIITEALERHLRTH
jgi:hypothetical protein